MSRSNIVVTTPERVFTFRPIVGPNPMISQYVDIHNGAAVLFDRLGIELRPSAAGNDGTRVVHRLNLAVPAIVASGNAQGYVSAPKLAGENKAVLNIAISKLSTLSQVTEFCDAVQAYVASDVFRQSILDQLIPQ